MKPVYVSPLVLGLSLTLGACAELGSASSKPDTNPLEPALAECRANFDALSSTQQSSASTLAAIQGDLEDLSTQFAASLRACEASAVAEVVPVLEETGDETLAVPVIDKLIVGSRERVWVEALQLALSARIDTGAETASLDARNIASFERDGKPWVSFEIPDPNGGDPIRLERRRVRQALVLQANSAEPERRPVIRLGIQLGPIRQLAEFTLSDRSNLDYQVLVGRNILRDVMIVDVSQNNLVPLPKVASENQANAL
ncbi:MAG: RimK/LysX family protein [Pseudomonadota bacterium]